MRKLWLLPCLLVLLCACAEKAPLTAPPIPLPLCGQVTLQSGSDTYTADFTFDGTRMQFTLLEPQTLSGVTVACSADGGEIGAADVRAPLPQSSAFLRLYRALCTDGTPHITTDLHSGKPLRFRPDGETDATFLYPEVHTP